MDTAQLIQILGGVATAIGGFFVGKGLEKAKTKKVEAETDSITVESAEKAVSIWENLNKRLSEELGNLRSQISEIKLENGKLHRENQELTRQVNILRQEVERLTALSR